jgi:hypothetical protein
MKRCAEDQWDGDGARVHDEDMLQAEEKEVRRAFDFVDRVDRRLGKRRHSIRIDVIGQRRWMGVAIG